MKARTWSEMSLVELTISGDSNTETFRFLKCLARQLLVDLSDFSHIQSEELLKHVDLLHYGKFSFPHLKMPSTEETWELVPNVLFIAPMSLR